MKQKSLPNAAATLVLGILSILTGCYFIGLILGIIALIISNDAMKLYREDPTAWSDYALLNAGRITAIIGTVLGGLSIFLWIFYLGIFSTILNSGYKNNLFDL